MNRIAAFMAVPAMMFVLPAQEPASSPKKMTEVEIEAFAHQAITIQDPAGQRAALAKIRAFHFKSSKVKEREFVLYAQGLLEDRLGETSKAAVTLRKLEVTWPQSPYLSQVQTILAIQAIDRHKYKDAEARLRKALDSDIPVESKRRTQEMLLWALAEQDRLAEGLPIVKTLQPLGSAKPSERGLVAILEVLCVAGEKSQAEAARKDLQTLYPTSQYMDRADLAWARLLGTTGDAPGSAELLRGIIKHDPNSQEADEARLALASLLTEGKLHPKEAEAFPTPEKLLAEIRRSDRKGNKAKKALLLELRLHMNRAEWKDALDTASKLTDTDITPDDMARTKGFRADALRSWTDQLLDKKAVNPLLPYLTADGINDLTAEQRKRLVILFAQTGLPWAAKSLIDNAPDKERASLSKDAADATAAESSPEETLKMLPAKGETPIQALQRAQALVALARWKEAKAALGSAKPGPERIKALLTYLQRPAEKSEGPASRLKEAEAWLPRLPEKVPEREPIVILVADLKAKAGDWRGALALYPEDPQKENRGWVALMRALCQVKLNQKEAAKATLKNAVDEADFKMERQTLGKQLGL